jgi:hypothetical protein
MFFFYRHPSILKHLRASIASSKMADCFGGKFEKFLRKIFARLSVVGRKDGTVHPVV